MLTVPPTFRVRCDDWCVGYNFAAVDRDQLMLLPPSMADWLAEDHLVWFVLDVVDQLDLSAFLAGYRADGRGGAAYHPAMMVALLVYAYSVGERSSRNIERRCVEDVAFRVVAANQCPDHATVARFRPPITKRSPACSAKYLRCALGRACFAPGWWPSTAPSSQRTRLVRRTAPLNSLPPRSLLRLQRSTLQKTMRRPRPLRCPMT